MLIQISYLLPLFMLPVKSDRNKHNINAVQVTHSNIVCCGRCADGSICALQHYLCKL